VDLSGSDLQDKCPKCGSTDISFVVGKGLVCNFCHYTWQQQAQQTDDLDTMSSLTGTNISTGAQAIQQDVSDLITLKCPSCGAEVVVNTKQETQARCHWCRQTLSINQSIPNGAVPDLVLPFSVDHEAAREKMMAYRKKFRFFCNTRFKHEFNLDNIMGVYLPYFMVDYNGHCAFAGSARQITRVHKDEHGNPYKWDYDEYGITREFDLLIDDLIVQSAQDKAKTSKTKTNNIIDAIAPFDTNNAIPFRSDYLRGFTSEKRDINVGQLMPLINEKITDVATYHSNNVVAYNGGISYTQKDVVQEGISIKTVYLPVWLYSYYDGKVYHYIAVNGRTGSVLGSIPLNMPKLVAVSAVIEVLAIVAAATAWLFS
jgi:ribosomal protein S27E